MSRHFLHVGDLVGGFDLVADCIFFFFNFFKFCSFFVALVALEDAVEELLEDSLYFLILRDEVLDLESFVRLNLKNCSFAVTQPTQLCRCRLKIFYWNPESKMFLS